MSELARLLLASALTLLSPITLLVTGIVVAVWLTTLCRARWFMLPGLLLAGIFWLTHDRTTLVTKTLTAWQQLFAEPTAWHLLPFVPLGLRGVALEFVARRAPGSAAADRRAAASLRAGAGRPLPSGQPSPPRSRA